MFFVGSFTLKWLGIKNHDVDVVCDKNEIIDVKNKYKDDDKYDIFQFIPADILINKNFLYLIFYDKKINPYVPSKYSINLFDYKEKLLAKYHNLIFFKARKQVVKIAIKKNEILPKRYYLAFIGILTLIFGYNSILEHKDEIVKIHDMKMEYSFIEELKHLLTKN